METPFKLEIQGLEPSSHIRNLIASNIVKVESRYGRITSCRVAIQAPGAHHRMGEPYAVSIHLALPNGREANVGRISKGQDHRQADVIFAINDAFRRVLRQLRDNARKLRGEVKQTHVAPEGRVTSVDLDRNGGFLATDDGRELYFHAHSVLGDHFRKLQVGDRVAFHEEAGEKGPQASTVRVLKALSQRR